MYRFMKLQQHKNMIIFFYLENSKLTYCTTYYFYQLLVLSFTILSRRLANTRTLFALISISALLISSLILNSVSKLGRTLWSDLIDIPSASTGSVNRNYSTTSNGLAQVIAHWTHCPKFETTPGKWLVQLGGTPSGHNQDGHQEGRCSRPRREERGRGERVKRRRELDYCSTGARRLDRAGYLAIRRRPAASEGTGCGR